MKSAKITVDLIDTMGSDTTVVNSARVSYGKEIERMSEKDEKLVKYLAEHEHFTPFEHCTATFRIKCPLYISKQIMRHRTFSYNEISRRYTEENLEFFIPEKFRAQHKKSKQCSDGIIGDDLHYYCYDSYKAAIVTSLGLYHGLLKAGVARELARGILPNCTMTEFYMTGNLRNYAHFVKLRIDEHAQEEVRVIGHQMNNMLKERFPISFEALMEY